jgi:PAS domain S-box-containing protein
MKIILKKYYYTVLNIIILVNILLIILAVIVQNNTSKKTERYFQSLDDLNTVQNIAADGIQSLEESITQNSPNELKNADKQFRHAYQMAKNINNELLSFSREDSGSSTILSDSDILKVLQTISHTTAVLRKNPNDLSVSQRLVTMNNLFLTFEKEKQLLESFAEQKLHVTKTNASRQLTVILLLIGILLFFILLQLKYYHKERNKAESKLLRSQFKYKHLIEAIPDIIWESDEKGVLTYLSPSVREILGYSTEQMTGHEVFSFMDETSRKKMEPVIQTLLDNQSSFEGIEIPMMKDNGEKITLEASGKPIFNTNKSLSGFRGIARDITTRKKIEKELEEERINLNALLNSSQDAMALITPDGNTLAANEAFAQRFNTSVDKIIHTNSRQFVDEKIQKRREDQLERMKNNRKTVEFIDEREGKILSNKLAPIFNHNNQLTRVAIFSRDITTEKKAADQLKESEELFRNFFEKNSAPMYLIDPETGQILDANVAAAKFYGFSKEKLKTININDINIQEIDEVIKEMNKAKTNNKNHFFFKHKLACGTIKDVEVYSSPVSLQNKTILLSVIHDITDRRKAEKALKSSELKFRQIFNHAPIGIFRSTQEGKFLEVNLETARMFGYVSPQEMVREIDNIGEQIYADTKVRNKILKKIQQSFVAEQVETELKKKNGDTFHVNLTIYPVRDNKLNIIHLEGVIQDITARKEAEKYIQSANVRLEKEVAKRTRQLYDINAELVKEINERKKIEEKLLSSQEFMDNLMNEIPDPIYVKNKQLELIHLNEAYAKIFGKKKEELLGKTANDLFPETKARNINLYDKLMFSSEISVEKNEHIIDGSEQKRVFLTKTALSKDPNKEDILIGVMRDITERKKTEEKIKENYEFLKILLNTIPNPVFYKDSNGRYLGVNTAFEKFIGYSQEELKGKKAEDVSPVKLAKEYQKKDADLLSKGGSQSYEWKVKNSSGEIRDVIFNKAAFRNADNKIGGFLGIITDITDRKQLEQEVIKEKELWRRSFVAISEGIFLLDNENNILQCNEAFSQIVGKKTDDILGKKIYEVIHGSNKTTSYCISCNAIKKGKHQKGEYWESHLQKYLYATADPVFHEGKLEFSINTLRDITEEKINQKALIENEEKFRRFVESSPIGIFLADKDGRYLDVNPAGLDILNYTKEELLRKTILEIVPESEKKNVQDNFQALKNHNNSNHETKLLASDGSTIEVFINAVKLQNQQFLAYVIDISDMKKAEAELIKSENKFRRIIENSPDGVILSDTNGRIIEWNNAQEQITGLPRENAINKKIWDVQTELASPHFKNNNLLSKMKNLTQQLSRPDALENNTTRLLDHTIYKFGKTERTVQSKIFPIPSEDGIMIGSFSQDVTLKRKALNAIKASEKKLRAIFDNSNQMFIILDPIGFITAFNLSAYKQAKSLFNREMKAGKTIYQVISDENKKIIGKHMNRVVRGEKTKLELQIKDQKRVEHWFEFNFVPIEENNLVTGIFMNITEITERKIAEQNIFTSLEREKELNQMKTRFISMVSHEFRTPMANIYSNTQLLEKFEKKWNEEKKAKSFKRIFDSVRILNSMLDDVSLFGKKQSGKLKSNPVPIDLIPFIKGVIDETLSNFNTGRKVLIQSNVQIKTFQTDKFLLRHSLTNLINNALKYSNSDSEVLLKLNQLNKAWLTITIIDKGMGIPKKELEYIFEPFYRSTNVENISGTGLGMAIVKHSIDLLKGKITINSQVGKGTEVHIKLPLAQAN